MKHLLILFALVSSCSVTVTDPEDVFLMQQEDIVGTWGGDSKVESEIQPGYFYDQRMTITVGPVDTSVYSIDKYMTDFYSGELMFMTITEHPNKGAPYVSQAGYLFDRGDEYGSSIDYSFKSTTNGMESPISFTQFHEDSLRITFSSYIYSVGR